MKIVGIWTVALVFLLGSGSLLAQQSPAQRKAITLKRQVQLNHYDPRPVDDSLSSFIFSSFITTLDRQQDIFTKDDYAILSAYRYSLDDELNSGSWKFLNLASAVFKKSLQRADSLMGNILQKPLDLTVDDKITISREKNQPFPADIKELRLKWNRWFKYIMLSHAYSLAEADSAKTTVAAVLAKNESILREKIRKAEARAIQSFLDPARFEEEMTETYLNAIATAFDPHTNYFSPLQKQDFQSALSTMEYSYGFEIDENEEGKTNIALLIPGGPAWKSGDIHKDDEILQLQWNGDPPVDASAMTAEEIEELIHRSKKDELSIKLKKTDGTVRTVVIRKEKIETEEDVVKGYFLAGAKNIGYISLPDFYTTWEDEKGSGCANDLAREIILMKKENLEGLIIDLRYNGGGSLYEALQLAGIFIDEGPMSATREKGGKLNTLKDPNRGTIYEGPLVIMVNNQSASASEMLAATLQDYNRAVIIGSTTYGKATMQVLFPMDSTAKPTSKKDSPDGYVKITTGKLYRVNGLTAQAEGVIPDILLPDAFEGLEIGEKYELQALPADSVKKNSYYKPLSPLPVAALAVSSKQRVAENEAFRKLAQGIKTRIDEKFSKTTVIPLQPASFEKWIRAKEERLKNLDEENEADSKLFKAGNHKQAKEGVKSSVYAAEMNAAVLESIQKDIYVEEAFRVILDLINLQKTKTN